VYFAVGSGCFVQCMHWTRTFFARRWAPIRVEALVVGLCLVTAVGIYLGRVDFNSWSLVTDPIGVALALGRLARHPTAIARTALAFVGALALTYGSEAVRRRRRGARHEDVRTVDADDADDADGSGDGSRPVVSLAPALAADRDVAPVPRREGLPPRT
jgi:hypothetical protein